MHQMGGCVRVPEGGAQFVDFSEVNYLLLNISKTQKLLIDFKKFKISTNSLSPREEIRMENVQKEKKLTLTTVLANVSFFSWPVLQSIEPLLKCWVCGT